jgi:hypothetical protein
MLVAVDVAVVVVVAAAAAAAVVIGRRAQASSSDATNSRHWKEAGREWKVQRRRLVVVKVSSTSS